MFYKCTFELTKLSIPTFDFKQYYFLFKFDIPPNDKFDRVPSYYIEQQQICCLFEYVISGNLNVVFAISLPPYCIWAVMFNIWEKILITHLSCIHLCRIMLERKNTTLLKNSTVSRDKEMYKFI